MGLSRHEVHCLLCERSASNAVPRLSYALPISAKISPTFVKASTTFLKPQNCTILKSQSPRRGKCSDIAVEYASVKEDYYQTPGFGLKRAE